MNITDELKEFFVKNRFISSTSEISEDDSLLENGIIDSVGMIELVSFIESKYDIKVDEDDLMPENFDSLKAIENFIKEKKNSS